LYSLGFRYHFFFFLLLPQVSKARLPWAACERQSTDYLPTNARFELPVLGGKIVPVPLPLLATAAVPITARVGGGGGATGVAYVTLIVQVAPGANVAPQELPVKVNNPDPFP
jgi:hypothetical protein